MPSRSPVRKSSLRIAESTYLNMVDMFPRIPGGLCCTMPQNPSNHVMVCELRIEVQTTAYLASHRRDAQETLHHEHQNRKSHQTKINISITFAVLHCPPARCVELMKPCRTLREPLKSRTFACLHDRKNRSFDGRSARLDWCRLNSTRTAALEACTLLHR